jgi:DNA-binding NtrC family response regulator
VIEDDAAVRDVIVGYLEAWDYEVSQVDNGQQALEMLTLRPADVVLTDWCVPVLGGLDLVIALRSRFPETPVVVLTGYPSIENAAAAARRGVCRFLTKPFDPDELRAALVEPSPLPAAGLPDEPLCDPEVVGLRSGLAEVGRTLDLFSFSEVHVLLEGETGTGKEAIARAIHRHGSRNRAPLVVADCTAIPPLLFDSEIFGHVKGAFTGAREDRRGLARQASGGVLFVDEITELPVEMQAKLLRMTEAGEVRPVGSDRWERVDIRVIAASSRDVRAEVARGAFRSDLYYRLAVVHLRIPPLRERLQDLPALVHHLAEKISGSAVEVDPEVMSQLAGHDWPGNVRELRNAVEYALVASGGGAIRSAHLPVTLGGVDTSGTCNLQEAELAKIREALEAAGGNRTEAARRLGISRATLYRKLGER